MWKRLIIGWTLTISALGAMPVPDGYDTLYTRSQAYILVPKYDTIKQLEQTDDKSDSILIHLQEIAIKLGITDTIKSEMTNTIIEKKHHR